MTLRVVGAGLGRTGTHSLKIALEQLLGAPCYHMIEVFGHPEHAPIWRDAARGEPTDWDALFDGYGATVDWPGAALWPELTAHYPDALVLLSQRESAEAWWRSANATIFAAMRQTQPPEMAAWNEMVVAMLSRFAGIDDEEAAKAAYDAHNAAVRAAIPAARLVEWRPGDGWEPLCAAFGVPVPSDPFPHVNTTDDFRAMTGLDAPQSG